MKIIGSTVGMGLPKPNLMQTDPKKGDYVKGKAEFLQQASTGGVYIGSGDMPDGYNVQIDPSGAADTAATQEWVANQIRAAIDATWEASY